jgi:hypothetical protein
MEKIEIKIRSNLGGSFIKGGKNKASIISVSRAINSTIDYYELNKKGEEFNIYLKKIDDLLCVTETIINDLSDVVKKEINHKKIDLDDDPIDNCFIEFSIENDYIKRFILLGMKADELFYMLNICLKHKSITINRNYISTNYNKPAIDSLKNCINQILKIDIEARQQKNKGEFM